MQGSELMAETAEFDSKRLSPVRRAGNGPHFRFGRGRESATLSSSHEIRVITEDNVNGWSYNVRTHDVSPIVCVGVAERYLRLSGLRLNPGRRLPDDHGKHEPCTGISRWIRRGYPEGGSQDLVQRLGERRGPSSGKLSVDMSLASPRNDESNGDGHGVVGLAGQHFGGSMALLMNRPRPYSSSIVLIT